MMSDFTGALSGFCRIFLAKGCCSAPKAESSGVAGGGEPVSSWYQGFRSPGTPLSAMQDAFSVKPASRAHELAVAPPVVRSGIPGAQRVTRPAD